jgi:hypothetical protein
MDAPLSKEEWDQKKAYPLSNDDIMSLIDLEPSNILTLPDLLECDNIDEKLDRKGRAIVLYLTGPNESEGHWIALLKRNNNIEVYDSYGFNPKNWEKDLSGGIDNHNQDSNELIKLIKDSGYSVSFNKVKNQQINPNISTCGRHAVMRLLFSKYSLPEYQKILKMIKKKYNISPDDLATGLTELSAHPELLKK